MGCTCRAGPHKCTPVSQRHQCEERYASLLSTPAAPPRAATATPIGTVMVLLLATSVSVTWLLFSAETLNPFNTLSTPILATISPRPCWLFSPAATRSSSPSVNSTGATKAFIVLLLYIVTENVRVSLSSGARRRSATRQTYSRQSTFQYFSKIR